jgi:hypothetical protein
MSADSIVLHCEKSGQTGHSAGTRELRRLPLLAILITGAVMLAGCGEDTKTPLTPPPPPPVYHASIGGFVTSTAGDTAIAGASVSIGDPAGAAASGAVSGVPAPMSNSGPNAITSTATDGSFLLEDVPVSSRMLVHMSKAGFVDGFPIVNTILGKAPAVPAGQLIPVAIAAPVTVATGGTVTAPSSTAAMVVAADSLGVPSGTAATGVATVSVTPVNPDVNFSSMPGDFTTTGSNSIESFGAISVTAVDENGTSLDLSAGHTATITIPHATRNAGAAPASLTLYHFDPVTGLWAGGNTATLSGDSYVGDIDKLGIWTVGLEITAPVTLSGCVVSADTGRPASNVRMIAEGIDFSGESVAVTDSTGHFSLSVRPSSFVVVSGQYGAYVTNSATSTNGSALPAPCLTIALANITLSWGSSPSDLDSHLFAPDGTHVYYVNRGLLNGAPYANLDVDDTSSFGPEVITLSRLMVGTYTYGVRNFSEAIPPGITGSPARVVFRQGGHVQVFSPGAGESGTDDWWTVFRFTVDPHCNITVTPINTFATAGDGGPPTIPAPVTRQYCSP